MSWSDLELGKEILAQCEGNFIWPTRWTWASIDFGRSTTIKIYESHSKEHEIKFLDPKTGRNIHKKMKVPGPDAFPLVRVKAVDSHPNRGAIQVQFSSTRIEITKDIYIVPDRSLESESSSLNLDWSRSINPGLLCLKLYTKHSDSGAIYLCRIPPDPFSINQSEQNISVRLITARGDVLNCLLQSNEKGREYLLATSIERSDDSKDKKGKTVFRRVDFIRVLNKVILVKNPDDVMEGDLEVLKNPGSTLVKASTEYHRVAREIQDTMYQKRADAKIFYDRVDPLGDSVYELTMKTWEKARDHWLLKPGKRNNTHSRQRIGVGIDLLKTPDEKLTNEDKDEPGLVENRKINNKVHLPMAVLEEVDEERDVARIVMRESRDIPETSGWISIANEPSNIQDKNRSEAMKRLLSGDCGLHNLIDILNDPSKVSPPTEYQQKSRLNTSQAMALRKALGNEDIVLILGPPGTGKTHVIVQYLLELNKKHRKENAPLRVLISSTQNEAVFNVTRKCQEKGMTVDHFLSIERKKLSADRLKEDNDREVGEIVRKVHAMLTEKPELQLQVRKAELIKKGKLLFDSLLNESWPSLITSLDELLTEIEADPLMSELMGPLLREGRRTVEVMKRPSSSIPVLDIGALNNAIEILNQELASHAQDRDSVLRALEQFDSTLTELDFEGEALEIKTDCRRLRRKLQRVETLDDYRELVDHLIDKTSEMVSNINHFQPEDPSTTQGYERQAHYWVKNCLRFLENAQETQSSKEAAILERWLSGLKDPRAWVEIKKKYADVIGATCQMSNSGRSLNNDQDFYDVVIIDEAARSELFEILIPMTLGHRILLVGDQHQLPPMTEQLIMEKLEKKNAEFKEALSGTSLFGDLYDQLPAANRCQLNVQYRSHPVIGEAVSKTWYDGQVKSGDELPGSEAYQSWLKEKQPCWGLFNNYPLIWLDSSVDNHEYTENCSLTETKLAINILHSLFDRHQDQAGIDVGLITFYNAQKDQLIAALREDKLITDLDPTWESKVTIGTVDSFQGKEFPLVILCCSRHLPHKTPGFLEFPNRINVAISRAQKQLVIIGSRETLLCQENGKGSTPFKSFVHHAGNTIHPYPEVEYHE